MWESTKAGTSLSGVALRLPLPEETMNLLNTIRTGITKFVRPSQLEAEIDDELRSHIEHRADDLARSGLTPAEARSSLRLSLSRLTTNDEITRALDIVPACVARLRSLT